MKNVLPFKPALLAEVERKSPLVYDYYCHSPLSRFEFVDYNEPGISMYMQKSVWETLKPVIKNYSINGIKLMDCLETSWMMGLWDLMIPHADDIEKSNREEMMNWKILQAALAYPSYDFDTLINSQSFKYKHDELYNLIVFQESQFFIAWHSIIHEHEVFNNLFMSYQNNQQIETIDTMEFFNRDSSRN